MSEGQFYINLFVMICIFVIGTFQFWLIDFQLEYLGSNLYLNFYLAGLVLVLSAQTTIWLYSSLGLRLLIQVMSLMMIPAFIFIVAINKRWLAFKDATNENMFVQISIPLSILVASLCQ